MAIGVDVKLKWNLRPREEVLDEVSNAVLEKLVEGAKNIVAHARKNHPYQDRTGENTRSIGWAVSPRGDRQFGPLTTGAGSTSTQGISSEGKSPVIIVATSSGHGGFLETGTVNMPAFPYIVPAFNAWKARILKSLEGIL